MTEDTPVGEDAVDGGTPGKAPAFGEIDTTVAHSARIYDYWLGGKDNFAADRAVGAAMTRAIPDLPAMARHNRRFLARAVHYLVTQAGIRQFLDIGTGLPAAGAIHDIAAELDPRARVVYVDNDPIVLAHARALMAGASPEQTAYLHADLRQPEQILEHPELRATLDLSEPVALSVVAILMLLDDSDRPHDHLRTLTDSLAPGSHLALTHPTQDFNPHAVARAVAAANDGNVTLVPRTHEEVSRFFGDWSLVDPGVVPVKAWRPDDGAPTEPESAYYWAGIARRA